MLNVRQLKISLRYKVLAGYIILVAVMVGMTAILLYDRHRIKEIEIESEEIARLRHGINNVHRHITELATQGEK